MNKTLSVALAAATVLVMGCSKQTISTAPTAHNPGTQLSIPALGISFLSPSSEIAMGPSDNGNGTLWSFETVSGFTAVWLRSKPYDQAPQGVWDNNWQVTTASKDRFSQQAFCEAFVDDSLPIDLQRTHLCDVTHTADGHLVLYGIGFASDDPRIKSEDKKGQAYLDSMIVVPLQDRVIFLSHLSMFPQTHTEVQKAWDAYFQVHSDQNSLTAFSSQDPQNPAAQTLENKLRSPSAEINSTLTILRKVSESIEISQ